MTCFTTDLKMELDDSSLLNGLQAIPAWNAYFGTPTGNWLGLFAASVYLPSFVFAFVGEQISNRYGRRVAIWVGTTILFIGGIWNAFATSSGQFIGSRIVIGSGGSIAKVAAPALLVEMAHPRLRPILGGVYYGLYYSGSFVSGCMCSKLTHLVPPFSAEIGLLTFQLLASTYPVIGHGECHVSFSASDRSW